MWSNSMEWKSPNIPTNPNCDLTVVVWMAACAPRVETHGGLMGG